MSSSLLQGELRPRSISKVIIDRIAEGIISGELAPGDRLPPEEEFAARVGVGRSSVREAMKILEAFGVVEIRRADGVYIAQGPRQQMVDPMVLGSLLVSSSAEDLVDLCIRMQRLVADDLMGPSTAPSVAECAKVVAEWPQLAGSAEAVCAQVSDLEERLGLLVPNPIIASLWQRSLQVSMILLDKALVSGGVDAPRTVRAFCLDLLRALESADSPALERLFECERSFLLASCR